MTSADLVVLPLGWETAPASERTPLPPVAHIMPKTYVLMVEVFPLPPGSPAPDAVVQSMQAGLAATLAQFPMLAATLQMDPNSGIMWVAKERRSGVHLHVQHLLEDGAFPSYDELEAKDFPAQMLPGERLLPAAVTAKQLQSPEGDNSEEGLAIAALQLTFIRGGLVLGLAVHHVFADGPGCDGFLTTWAENTAAAARGAPFPARSTEAPDATKPPLHVEVPSAARLAAIQDAYPVLKDAGGPMPPPPPGFVMPTLVPQMWHVPKSKLAALKALAGGGGGGNGGGGDGSWVSTYDAVVGLLWGRITAARLPLLQPDLATAETLCVHAVNSRRLWTDPPLPERYLGVAAVPARAGPLPVREAVSDDLAAGLPKLAAAVRAATAAITRPFLQGMLEWIVGRADQRYLESDVRLFLGLDVGASSWQGIAAYEAHDFGFGLPRALRWPSPKFDGFVFVYPSRAAFKSPDADEGIELVVCLEASCQARLCEDKVLLAFAQPRG